MKVYSDNIFDWATCVLESCVEHDYSGPVLECKKDSKTPPPPDPYVVAGAQTQQNQRTAEYNAALERYNSTNPLGSQTWEITGHDPTTGAPIYSQRTTLSPEQQALYEQQTGQSLQLGDVGQSLISQAKDAYGQPISTAGLPALTGSVPLQTGYQTYDPQMRLDTGNLPALPGANDLTAFRDQAQQAVYDRNATYLDPQWQRSDEALRTRLANQGIVEGSEAWRNAMQDQAQAKETAYRQARNEAVAAGGEEAQRMFGIGSAARGQLYGEALSGGQFGNEAARQATENAQTRAMFGNQTQMQGADLSNQARQQGVSELFAFRNQPINELNAVRNMSEAQMPQFGNPGGPAAAPADISGAIQNQYQAQVDAANAQNAAKNQRNATYATLLASTAQYWMPWLAGLSDERTKDDHGVIGETKDEIPVHLFNYKGSPETHVGVMAQEAKKKRPDAVMKGRDGLYRVNYFALA